MVAENKARVVPIMELYWRNGNVTGRLNGTFEGLMQKVHSNKPQHWAIFTTVMEGGYQATRCIAQSKLAQVKP